MIHTRLALTAKIGIWINRATDVAGDDTVEELLVDDSYISGLNFYQYVPAKSPLRASWFSCDPNPQRVPL
jgi:hypothetical protein